MASNPNFIIPDFFLHFPNEVCYGYLRFEGNEKKSFGKVEKKVCSVGCLSLAKLNWDLFLYLPKGFFPFPSNLRLPLPYVKKKFQSWKSFKSFWKLCSFPKLVKYLPFVKRWHFLITLISKVFCFLMPIPSASSKIF